MSPMTTIKTDDQAERDALVARIEATGFRSPLLVNEDAESLRSMAEACEAQIRRYEAAGFKDMAAGRR